MNRKIQLEKKRCRLSASNLDLDPTNVNHKFLSTSVEQDWIFEL